VEEGTTEQVAQLKELVYRLLRSHDEQKATQELQQKDLAATIEAQTKTIAKLEATVQGQAAELKDFYEGALRLTHEVRQNERE
jgi:hypothetical protein